MNQNQKIGIAVQAYEKARQLLAVAQSNLRDAERDAAGAASELARVLNCAKGCGKKVLYGQSVYWCDGKAENGISWQLGEQELDCERLD